NNRTGWSHQEFDALIATAFRTTDAAKRLEILSRAEKILIEDEWPIQPIYTYVSKKLVSPRVTGWVENLRDLHPFKDLSLKP
ncbi:MAG: peptide ABC transporter substrate-binding protein, partial [Dehalococcoidia bacterium]|nr:peptide ABC transporter substrate-binding protein [Dehalococcoidia bacterium]